MNWHRKIPRKANRLGNSEYLEIKALRLTRIGRQLRAKALFHAAAQLAACPHTVYSMAKWWQPSYPSMGEDPRPMWRGMFHGSTSVATSDKLYRKLPALRSVFYNPLWAVLSQRNAGGQWDELAESIRVGDKPLDGYHGKFTTLLFDRVDWPCFAVHLVLLRTRHPRYLLHRMWLARNLTAMYALNSVQSPIISIREELYRELSLNMPGSELSCPPIDRWSEWSIMHHINAGLVEQTRELDWISCSDQHLVLFIWNFEAELRGHLTELELDGRSVSRTLMPHALRHKWTRKLQEWHDHPVSLNGCCCDS